MPDKAGESKEGMKQEVDQKGSLNNKFNLRFYISWNRPLTPCQLRYVDNSINTRIGGAVTVRPYVASL